MSCYHCSIKPPLTAAKGKSLIAKAAYNARTQYRDERTGRLTRNYEGDGNVIASYVMYDDRIKAPAWVKEDPEKMLNESVRGLRSNARQGQEIIFGLIDEFDLEGNRRLLHDFLREQICRKTGHVVFVNIHPPSGKGDERNIHAHVLLMPRGLDKDGFTEESLPSLTPQDYDRIRDKWAEYGARELRKLPGMDLEADRYRWGHLKLRPDPKDRRSQNGNNQRDKATERGDKEWAVHCDREAQRHLGPEGNAMDRKSRTRKGDINREIREQIQEKVRRPENDPEIDGRYPGVHRKLPDDIMPAKREEWNAWIAQNNPNDKYFRAALPVWWAYHMGSALEFEANLKKEGFLLARVTKEDAEIAHTRHWAAKRDGAYSPILKEGEYVAVNEKKGWAFRLHEGTVGHNFRDVKDHLTPLDKTFVNPLRATENIVEFKRMKGIDPRPTGRDGKPGRAIDRKSEKAAGLKLLWVGAGMVLDPLKAILGGRSLTPQERAERDMAMARQQAEAAAKRDQDNREKDRGSRER